MFDAQSHITLPNNWLEIVNTKLAEDFCLSENKTLIAHHLLNHIKILGKNSVGNPLLLTLILKAVFPKVGYSFLPEFYNEIPKDILEDGLKSEVKNITNWYEYTKKLYSLFLEFLAYAKLREKYNFDISFSEFIRTDGSPDLKMSKDGKDIFIEVKFKESRDEFKSRLIEYLQGASYLEENSFLKGKLFNIDLLITVRDGDRKYIFSELNKFLESKKELFQGKYINISQNRVLENILYFRFEKDLFSNSVALVLIYKNGIYSNRLLA